MSIDTQVALAARANMEALVILWPRLLDHLGGIAGISYEGSVTGSTEPRLPINTAVSDLLYEVEESTRFYAHVLMDETDWTPETSAMPALLVEVMDRYGHFVTGDDEKAQIDFTDTWHELRRKAEGVVSEERKSRAWFGPCPAPRAVGEDGCPGQLHAVPGSSRAACPICGTETDLVDQRKWLGDRLDAHLMTKSEIASALRIEFEGDAPTFDTVCSWVRRKKLKPAEEGLYRLQEARELVRPKMVGLHT